MGIYIVGSRIHLPSIETNSSIEFAVVPKSLFHKKCQPGILSLAAVAEPPYRIQLARYSQKCVESFFFVERYFSSITRALHGELRARGMPGNIGLLLGR